MSELITIEGDVKGKTQTNLDEIVTMDTTVCGPTEDIELVRTLTSTDILVLNYNLQISLLSVDSGWLINVYIHISIWK